MILLRRIVGNSMLPGFLPGDIVVGVRVLRRHRLRPGQVVIINHGGREKVKRIAEINGDELYVLGDNPQASTDSRHFGWISLSDVKARVIWPRPKPGDAA
jgi:nickel-type superoxide dismutase maturation protease